MTWDWVISHENNLLSSSADQSVGGDSQSKNFRAIFINPTWCFQKCLNLGIDWATTCSYLWLSMPITTIALKLFLQGQDNYNKDIAKLMANTTAGDKCDVAQTCSSVKVFTGHIQLVEQKSNADLKVRQTNICENMKSWRVTSVNVWAIDEKRNHRNNTHFYTTSHQNFNIAMDRKSTLSRYNKFVQIA